MLWLSNFKIYLILLSLGHINSRAQFDVQFSETPIKQKNPHMLVFNNQNDNGEENISKLYYIVANDNKTYQFSSNSFLPITDISNENRQEAKLKATDGNDKVIVARYKRATKRSRSRYNSIRRKRYGRRAARGKHYRRRNKARQGNKRNYKTSRKRRLYYSRRTNGNRKRGRRYVTKRKKRNRYGNSYKKQTDDRTKKENKYVKTKRYGRVRNKRPIYGNSYRRRFNRNDRSRRNDFSRVFYRAILATQISRSLFPNSDDNFYTPLVFYSSLFSN